MHRSPSLPTNQARLREGGPFARQWPRPCQATPWHCCITYHDYCPSRTVDSDLPRKNSPLLSVLCLYIVMEGTVFCQIFEPAQLTLDQAILKHHICRCRLFIFLRSNTKRTRCHSHPHSQGMVKLDPIIASNLASLQVHLESQFRLRNPQSICLHTCCWYHVTTL